MYLRIPFKQGCLFLHEHLFTDLFGQKIIARPMNFEQLVYNQQFSVIFY